MNPMKKISKRGWVLLLALSPLVVAVAFVALFTWKVYQRNAQGWVPHYLHDIVAGRHVSDSIGEATDLVFVFVDHHEHPFPEAEARASAQSWMRDYRKTVGGITDDYGRPFQYTWFYPFDGGRTPVALLDVNDLVYDGLGEIEFHWHNNEVSNEQFNPNLKRGIAFFQGIGAMRGYGPEGRTAFGYIAGNWALDNGLKRKPGASRELDHLKAAGCYADFTFSNTSISQPPIYSSIYYAQDDDRAQSYDHGTPARVGARGQGFMIFEGPSSIDLKRRTIELGIAEAWYGSDWDHRVSEWFENAPIVQGRPQWRFVKVYTHGVQSREMILSEKFRRLPLALKAFAKQRGVRLHFATAREAYNMVRAAEDGKQGDPQQFLDYEIPPPVNRFVHLDSMARTVTASDESLAITGTGEPLSVRASRGPLATVSGRFNEVQARLNGAAVELTVVANEPVRVASRKPLAPATLAQSVACPANSIDVFCYEWSPTSDSAPKARQRMVAKK
jgi:hypothetical protein